MQYRFVENDNYEDLSCGRVIFHKAGFANYPVRLVCEIFMRCLEIIDEPNKKVVLYDPCCGGGYLLTVLGFMYGEKIDSLCGSDIAEDAVCLAKSNFELLTSDGLLRRKEQLETLYRSHGKESHQEAIISAKNLLMRIENKIKCFAFQRDILDYNEPVLKPLADVIITDVPYGNLVSWSTNEPFAIDKMLDNLLHNQNENTVVVISSDKQQKISNPQYKRIQKFQVGKRKIEILKKV